MIQSLIFAAGGAPPLVTQLAIVLIGAAVVGYFCQRIGIIPIVGYLAVGVITGPNALGIVDDTDLVDQAAEIGVIFLLFAIGLELSGDQLRRMGGLLFGGGLIQVGLTVVAIMGVGLLVDVPFRVGIYTGMLVALSSTAVVLKLLSERGETGSPTGEVAVAFLIFQDIAVVVMVLLVPMLGEGGGSLGDIVEATIKSLILIVGVVIATRYVVPPLLGAVSARTNNEEFLLAVLAIAVGVGYLVTLLGLSASLGAFIGGLVVSSGPHRERATRFVEPFQIVFAAVFFASIGMLLDPEYVVDELGTVLLFAAFIVALKVVTTGIAARVFHRPWPIVAASALLLSQLGEFAFVLERAGREAGLQPFDREDGAQTFIATAVILFALTPALYEVGQKLKVRLEARSPAYDEVTDGVVLIGNDRWAAHLAAELEGIHPGLHIVVADASGLDTPAPAPGTPNPAVRLLVVDYGADQQAERAIERARRYDPPVPVVVRAPSRLDVENLQYAAGVEIFVDEDSADQAFERLVLDALSGPESAH